MKLNVKTIQIIVLFVAFAMILSTSVMASREDAPLVQDNTTDTAPSYLGPEEVLFVAENELCVLERDASRIDFFSLTDRRNTDSIQLPQMPNSMSKCGERLYVSSGFLNGAVWEIDLQTRQVLRRWVGIHSPWGLVCSPKRNLLYVGRRFHGDILILDLNQGKGTEIPWESTLKKSVKVVREPCALTIVPDESEVYVANLLPLSRSDGSTVSCCFSILNTETETVENIQLPDGCGSLRDICVSPDGHYVFMVHTHGNHRTITSQLFGGWTNRNGFTIYDRKRRGTCTYLIDNFQEGLTNPWSIRVSPDGKLLAIAVGGNREIGFVGMDELIERMERDMNTTNPQYVFFFGVGSFTPTIVRVKVPELSGMHALAMSETMTVVGGYFTDNLALFRRDNAPERIQKSTKTGKDGKPLYLWQTAAGMTEIMPEIINLGEKPPILDARRLGEKDFFDGERALDHWHSCITCHPDARVDGMNWDLLNDGVENPKNSKNMLYAHVTPPNMITGVREDGETATRAGFVHIHFKPMSEAEYCNVDEYLKSLIPVPGITLNADGTLTDSAKRGKRLFYGTKTGCSSCHSGPYFTDMKMHDVGTQNEVDFDGMFDTPTLIETFRTAPYLHDGRYLTLEELLWEGRHGEMEPGRFDHLSEQEKADLIEFVLSL